MAWGPGAVDGAGSAGRHAVIHLITGGARSGKSTFALQQALRLAPEGPVGFIATAQANDADMAERIARHRAERDERFLTFEAPLDLGAALADPRPAGFVVDCLTVWCANLLFSIQPDWNDLTPTPDVAPFDRTVGALLGQLSTCNRPILLVTNEVGYGIVPADPLSRTYRDWLGRLNQRIAARAERVTLVVAGIPVAVKGGG